MTESKPSNPITLLTHFSSGAAAGLAIAALFWSDNLFYWHPVTLKTGFTVSLVVGIVCGLLTLKWGNKFLQALWDGIIYLYP